MYNRLIEFINKLYKYQFGFRGVMGTNTAKTILIDKIVSALDNGDSVIGVFLDFSKAFDTVDQTILLKKLHKLGIRGLAYAWIKGYLTNRKQFVSSNNVTSSNKTITCGVPQGSILGPLLFLLHMNDIVNVSPLLFTILYADDPNSFYREIMLLLNWYYE